MPKLNASRVKHRLAALDLTTEALAQLSEIRFGTLRNAVAGRDTMHLNRIYRVAHFLKKRREKVEAVVADILATNEGVPDEPPKQPRREPTHPSPRKDGEDTKKTGPKRVRSSEARAS